MSEMIKLTGLWVNKTKDDEEYFSGYFGNAHVKIFKNKYRTDENKQPHYNMYLAAPRKKESENDQLKLPVEALEEVKKKKDPMNKDPFDEDIPF